MDGEARQASHKLSRQPHCLHLTPLPSLIGTIVSRRTDITEPATTNSEAHGATYQASSDVVVERLGESVLAVHLGTDKILELNDTAARLLDLLLEGRTEAEATEIIAAEYDAPSAEVAANVSATLRSLLEEQVVERAAG